MLTIFEPLGNVETDNEPLPRDIISDSKKCLHTIIRMYYLRHGFDAMDIFVVIPLISITLDCIDDLESQAPSANVETLRSTITLATKGIYDQRQNVYIAEALFRVIQGRMRSSELALLKGMMSLNEDESSHQKHMMQVIRSKWPVTIVKKSEDLGSSVLNKLLETYAMVSADEDPLDE